MSVDERRCRLRRSWEVSVGTSLGLVVVGSLSIVSFARVGREYRAQMRERAKR